MKYDVSGEQPSFVMTLQFDDRSLAILQEWRTRFFPAERNHIPAHLTLLHKVSAEQVSRLKSSWLQLENRPPIILRYSAPRFLGNGVAIDVDSPELLELRERLVDLISGTLTRQDQQRYRPHVTIQNKVSAGEATVLYESLCSSFEPWYGEGTAVLIWKYLGGPWAAESRLALEAVSPS